MAKRFITAFAEAGDRAAMPDIPTGTDSNYQTGYPSQYEEDPVVNPLTAKFVERDKSNQLYNDITANIKEWQEHVYPAFITSAVNGGLPFSYKNNSIVTLGGIDYASIVDGNEDVPPSSKWVIYNTSLINYLSQTYNFKSVSEYKASTKFFPVGKVIKILEFATGDGGGSSYTVISGTGTANDVDIIGSTAVNQSIVLTIDGSVNADQVGIIGDDLTDNTAHWLLVVAALDEGIEIIFTPNKIYHGSFISTKSFNIVAEGVTFKDNVAGRPLFKFEGSSTLISTVTADMTYGDTSFAVAAIGSIVAGDIIYVVDGTTRPSDASPDINTELLKVKSVSTNTITVEDKIRSEQTFSKTINCHKLTPVVKPSFTGGVVNPLAPSNNIGLFFEFCDRPKIRGVETTNTFGDAVAVRHCYKPDIDNMDHKDPQGTGSGQGYGTAILACRDGVIRNIKGNGMRHVFDANMCYGYSVKYINEVGGGAAGGSPVILCHNTFGGNITCEHVDVTADSGQGVSVSGDGVSAAFVVHDVNVRHVQFNNLSNSASTSSGFFSGVALANSNIEDINHYILDTVAAPTIASSIVSIEGIAGAVLVSNIYSNKIGIGLLAETDGSSTTDFLTVDNVNCPDDIYDVWLRGVKNTTIGTLSTGHSANKLAGVRADTLSSILPLHIDMNTSINNADGTVPILDLTEASSNLFGKWPTVQSSVGTASADLIGGEIITQEFFQNRLNYMKLVGESGVGDISLDATTPFERPFWKHMTMEVEIASGRKDIRILNGSTTVTSTADIVLAAGNIYRFKEFGGKWFITDLGAVL